MSALMAYVPKPLFLAGCELRRVLIDDPIVAERKRRLREKEGRSAKEAIELLGVSLFSKGAGMRASKPGHIPTVVRIPGKPEIKLFVPRDTWRIVDLMHYLRKTHVIRSSQAIFLSSNGRSNILAGHEYVLKYDEPATFPVLLITAMFENTFGSA
jgi:hypothetical protein